MSKITWKPGTMMSPLPPVMVSSGTMTDNNIFTVAWTGIINSEPAMTYISVRPERYSHQIISKSGEFVINLVDQKLVQSADFCGVRSGRDLDKFKETKLTPEKSSVVKAPQIHESPISIECKVVDVKHLGSHDMFLAEIVAVNIDDRLMENGRLALEKANLVCYCHGHYYAVGQRIGKFGFSVEKKKSRKQRIREIKAEREARRERANIENVAFISKEHKEYEEHRERGEFEHKAHEHERVSKRDFEENRNDRRNHGWDRRDSRRFENDRNRDDVRNHNFNREDDAYDNDFEDNKENRRNRNHKRERENRDFKRSDRKFGYGEKSANEHSNGRGREKFSGSKKDFNKKDMNRGFNKGFKKGKRNGSKVKKGN